LGYFNKKKISYDGYKALAYLHPNIFNPSKEIIEPEFLSNKLFIIRCTGFAAHHDLGRKGIDDFILEKIIELLKDKGNILISSERELPVNLRKYLYTKNKNNIFHYMAYADLFIGDSVSMCTEAALLGTPVVEYDDYWHEMEQLLELQYKYKLINLFQPPDYQSFLNKIEEIISSPNYKNECKIRKDKFIEEKIDVSSFLTWFMENYPNSYNEYKKNPFIQYNFKSF
jgi:hypothetical protein